MRVGEQVIAEDRPAARAEQQRVGRAVTGPQQDLQASAAGHERITLVEHLVDPAD